MNVTANSYKNVKLKVKDLLTLSELTKEEILQLMESAVELKKLHKEGKTLDVLKGKTMGMIFDKPSTRTRVSFEAGMVQLGGAAQYLDGKSLQLGRGESIADTAKVLSEYIDVIMIRTFEHAMVQELAENATIPVINGLTDEYHPCQGLADLLTVYEIKGGFEGYKLVYVGDGNNVAHSLMLGAAKVGLHCTIACPEGYEPSQEVVKLSQEIGKETGSVIEVSHNAEEAVSGADFIYTDVWTSMGQEAEQVERTKQLQPFQVNEKLMSFAKEDYTFMHCLPAHRGEEVTAEVIDGNHSVVFEQAGNRLHVQKALTLALL